MDCSSGASLLLVCALCLQSIFSAVTVPLPSSQLREEEHAGKFDANYLAVSLYNVDGGDVRGGYTLAELERTSSSNSLICSREHLKLRGDGLQTWFLQSE